jgi:hypothetical protein
LDLSQVTASEQDQTIVLNHGIRAVEPSHWAFGQLSSWIHAPGEYLRRLTPSIAVDCINDGLKKSAIERGSLKFMTVSEEEKTNTLQAVTSTTYGRIWDADVAECTSRIVERTNGKFFNPKAYDIATGQPKPSGLYASDRDIFIFMINGGSLLDAGPRAQLHRGFFMWNSEVGARTFGLTTFLFNAVCGNHIVWGAQNVKELRIRHTQNGPARFDSDAAPSLLSYCESSAAPELDTIRKAQQTLLPSVEPELTQWFTNRKFSRTEAKEAIATATREEGQCVSVWDAVQGLTAYARGFDFVDARVDVETRAGKLLDELA